MTGAVPRDVLRGRVTFRCGAEADVEYPAGHPEVLSRFRKQAAKHDCPGCAAGLPLNRLFGPHVVALDGQERLDVWVGRESERP